MGIECCAGLSEAMAGAAADRKWRMQAHVIAMEGAWEGA